MRAQYAETQRLARLLSGHNTRKMPIEQFVLSVMLEDILSRANVFFADLSGGRYRPFAPAGARFRQRDGRA